MVLSTFILYEAVTHFLLQPLSKDFIFFSYGPAGIAIKHYRDQNASERHIQMISRIMWESGSRAKTIHQLINQVIQQKSFASKTSKHLIVPTSQMWRFAALGLGCSIRQKEQFEGVTLGSGKLWWAFFTLFWCFLDLIHHQLIRKIISRFRTHRPKTVKRNGSTVSLT